MDTNYNTLQTNYRSKWLGFIVMCALLTVIVWANSKPKESTNNGKAVQKQQDAENLQPSAVDISQISPPTSPQSNPLDSAKASILASKKESDPIYPEFREEMQSAKEIVSGGVSSEEPSELDRKTEASIKTVISNKPPAYDFVQSWEIKQVEVKRLIKEDEEAYVVYDLANPPKPKYKTEEKLLVTFVHPNSGKEVTKSIYYDTVTEVGNFLITYHGNSIFSHLGQRFHYKKPLN